MRARWLAGVFASAMCAFSGAALAQEGLSTKPDYDLIYKADRIDEDAGRNLSVLKQQAISALQAKDYLAAETALAELLRREPASAGASFLMGLAKIGLEKWQEAQPFLERATLEEPKRPEPKTRLGVAYAKLGDADRARGQRAALASLDADCSGACKDDVWIKEGLALLDQALASEEKAQRVSAAALAAVTAGDRSKAFEPEKYSLVTFSDKDDLFNLLTQEGRCPRNKTAERRQPCALILYRPVDGPADSLATNFKPVFKVTDQRTIWAIHDKQLQRVRIEDLYFDNVDVIGGQRATYLSVALVGNAENAANCQQGKLCLSHLVEEDMFRMYGNMPDSVADIIWGGARKDVGTVRIR